MSIKTETLPDTQKVVVWSKISWELRNKDFRKALLYIDKALYLGEKIGYEYELAHAYNYKGVILRNLGDYENALKQYLKALALSKKTKREQTMAYSYNNIGEIYKFQTKYNEANNYIRKAAAIFERTNDHLGEAYCFLRLGEIAQANRKYEEALIYYQKCATIREKYAKEQDMGIIFSRIGSVLREKNDIPKAIKNIENAISFFTKMQDEQGIVAAWIELGKCHQQLNAHQESIVFATKALHKAQQMGASEYVRQASQILYEVYAQKEEYKKAFEYQSIFIVAKDSVQSKNLDKAVLRLEESYKLQEKQTEIDTIRKDSEYKKTQMWWLIFAIVGAIIVLVIVIVFSIKLQYNNQLRNKIFASLRDKHELIEFQKQEIEQQHEELKGLLTDLDSKNKIIAKKNEDITSSINYAKNIQKALLPQADDIAKYLPNHFIFYRPRDIVSGDYYWFADKRLGDTEAGKIIFALGDCTGHGVPGAFMSMIADSLLNQIIHDAEIHVPELILKELNDKVYRNLNQYQNKNRDGMELGICVITPSDKKLRYAGAGNSLVYMQKGEQIEIKGELGSVGGYQVKMELAYIGHDVIIDTPTMLYLYSDGFQDQFGGTGKKRITTKRFKRMLYDVHKLPINMQVEVMEDFFLEWKGNYDQIDDVTVVGILLDFDNATPQIS